MSLNGIKLEQDGPHCASIVPSSSSSSPSLSSSPNNAPSSYMRGGLGSDISCDPHKNTIKSNEKGQNNKNSSLTVKSLVGNPSSYTNSNSHSSAYLASASKRIKFNNGNSSDIENNAMGINLIGSNCISNYQIQSQSEARITPNSSSGALFLDRRVWLHLSITFILVSLTIKSIIHPTTFLTIPATKRIQPTLHPPPALIFLLHILQICQMPWSIVYQTCPQINIILFLLGFC